MMTQKKWSEKSEQEYKDYARGISSYVTIRTYSYGDNGTSYDDTRTSTESEAKAIYGICLAAMLAYGRRKDADLHSILDTAEFAGHFLISDEENVNCYDTIYIPLQKVMGEWS